MVTASWMQLELKASMWLSSTKLTPHMLITRRLGVACTVTSIVTQNTHPDTHLLEGADVEHLVHLPLLLLTLDMVR